MRWIAGLFPSVPVMIAVRLLTAGATLAGEDRGEILVQQVLKFLHGHSLYIIWS